MSSKILAFVGSTLMLVGSAQAQTAASTDPAAVKAGTYSVEPRHTRVLFGVSHFGFSTWYGDFSNASGTLTLDPKQPRASRLDITVPISSVSTTNSQLDGELKSADWFDATRFPTMRFVSRSVLLTRRGQADGITRPVTLHVKFHGAGSNPLDKAYTAGFDASGVIRRSQFGVAKYVPMVGDEVELILSGAFVKPAA